MVSREERAAVKRETKDKRQSHRIMLLSKERRREIENPIQKRVLEGTKRARKKNHLDAYFLLFFFFVFFFRLFEVLHFLLSLSLSLDGDAEEDVCVRDVMDVFCALFFFAFKMKRGFFVCDVLGFIDVVIRVLVEVVVFLKIRSSSREIHRYSLGRETTRGTPKTPSLYVFMCILLLVFRQQLVFLMSRVSSSSSISFGAS